MPVHLFSRPGRALLAAAAACVALAAPPAKATWSVLIVDTRTGEIALGSATCLIRLDLRELTPVLVSGSGAVTAQSSGDSDGFTRSYIRDRLLEGVPVADILIGLSKIDGAHQTRQYGMIDVQGGAVTFTGDQAGAWRGGLTGQIGDLVYAVQGNVLSGGNVVTNAAHAIVNTPGDVADKLLASMIAARQAGGDGRCSCDTRNPESCGSPPPAPFKSAHIGYMMIARAGDANHSRVYYFDPRRPGYFAATDTNGDGLDDIVATVFGTTELVFATNRTVPGADMSHVTIEQTVDVGLTGALDLHAEDVTGDGIDDLVCIASSPAGVTVFEGVGDGTFDLASPSRFATGGAPTRLKLAQFDNDPQLEMVVSQSSTGAVSIIDWNTSLRMMVEIGNTAVPGQPRGFSATDLDGDGLLDLAVARFNDDTLGLYRNAGRAFIAFDPIGAVATDDEPIDVVSDDFNGDGVLDLAVIHDAGESLRTYAGQAGNPGAPADLQTLALVNDGLRVDMVDPNADGVQEILAFSFATGNAAQFFSHDGAGAFEIFHENTAGAGQLSALLADLDNDGLPDYISGSNRRGMTIMNNRGDGTYPLVNGFANGAYFMDLNVPDTFASDPDPVDTLTGMFAEWRAGLEGRIDAVRTGVVAPSRVVAGASYAVRIDARDWRGDPLSPVSIDVETRSVAGSGSAGSSSMVEPGVVELVLNASPSPSDDETEITLDDGTGPVVLMPALRVMVLESLADFDGSGSRDFFDIVAYLGAYRDRDPAADLDQNGLFDSTDVAAFVALLLAP